jgi:undecaprenyl-diphosphatase
MPSLTINDILAWVELHPQFTYAGIFLASVLESIPIIGLLLPGGTALIGVGMLAGAGYLEVVPCLLYAGVGGFIGDMLAFQLGRYYRKELEYYWPFSRWPGLLRQGRAFFSRHGGKSVIMGRFVGVMRPMMPLIAGMARMSPLRFFLFTVLAGLLWAPAYILPGVVIGTSFALASEIGMQLVIFLGLLIAILWITSYGLRISLNFISPYIELAVERLLRWSESQRSLSMIGDLADPRRPEAAGLLALTLLLTAFGCAVAILLNLERSLPTHSDLYVASLLASLRTPRINELILWPSYLGNWECYGLVLSLGSLGLLLRQRRFAVLHWLAALAPTLVFSLAMWLWLADNLAPELLNPLDHSGNAIAIYSFLTFLLGRGMSHAGQRALHSLTIALLTLMLMARLYLGLEWLSMIVLETLLALTWVSLLSMAYRRRAVRPLPRPRLAILVAAALVINFGLYNLNSYQSDADAFEQRQLAHIPMDESVWLAHGWNELPKVRKDTKVAKADRFTLQWAGNINTIRDTLLDQGWQQPPPFNMRNVLHWFATDPLISELPVLPRLHDHRYPVLSLTMKVSSRRHYLLTLWDTGIRLQPSNKPLWIGMLVLQKRAALLSTLHYPSTLSKDPVKAEALLPYLKNMNYWGQKEGEAKKAYTYLLIDTKKY